MAQMLKDEVEARIRAAALEVFAQLGFERATMATIGNVAQVSTGNIYRYYRNKEALFDALLSEAFAGRFVELLRQRAEALKGIDDLQRLDEGDRYHLLSEELLVFCLSNRLQVVILLAHSQGTRHDAVPEKVVQTLVEVAFAHYHALAPSKQGPEPSRAILELIYRNFVSAMVAILSQNSPEAALREAIAEYSAYHLSGLTALFSRRPA